MKRVFFLLLVLALLLAGCAAHYPEVTAQAPEAMQLAPGVKVVNSVDELLSAIEPGAVIELGEGEFNLTTASDYGKRKGPYYIWEELGDGQYGLKLQYVDVLVIRGAGMDKTKLVTDPRWPHVLTLMDCKNVILEGMTLGHTESADVCEGGVVHLDHCQNTALRDLGLFGCGTIGVWAYACDALEVVDCEIYDCSGSGISLSQCQTVNVVNCDVYSLGKDMPARSCFDIWDSGNVTVEGCTVRDNYVYNLIYTGPGAGVTFSNNTFQNNKIAEAAFAFDDAGVIFDNNTFEETNVRRWYRDHKAKEPESEPVEFEELCAYPVAPGVAEAVSTGEQKEVKVQTVDQFLAAIAPNTKILLSSGEFDLSKAKDYGNETQYCYWEDNYDGPSLVIHGVENLTIQGAGPKETTISAVPRYANVLTFENCSAITVKDLTAGHTIEPGECMGGVLLFRDSTNCLVEVCGLYGCGTFGVQAERSQNLQIVNSEIYECSYGGVWFQNSENITISGTTFRDLGGPVYSLWNCVNVTANGDSLDGNYTGD